MGQTVLEMTGIKKSFSGIYALNGIDFSLELGEVHALLGENGAGKSTLIKVLGGIHQPDCGTIKINGKEVKIHNVPEARENGIGIIHQEIVLVPYLTVAQNLFLGREIVRHGVVDLEETNQRAAEMIASLGVDIDSGEIVENLTIAQQQMVEIVKAVSFNGKIIVMDEPTSSLSNEEVEQLFEIIARLKAKKVSIIYISHRMNEVFRIADTAMVMRDGQYIAKVPVSDTDTDQLVAYMVGREITDMYPARDVKIGEEVFAVEDLSTDWLKHISFSIRAGEVVGLFGLMGAGRTEIASCIVGSKTVKTSRMRMAGKPYAPSSPGNALKNKIAYVPAERKEDGLILVSSVKDNITISNLDAFISYGKMNLKKEEAIAEEWIRKLRIKTPKSSTVVESLSGGNQQKVVVAKALNTKPELVILNEPTRGIDVGAKVEIYTLINELCAQGKAILMISSELPEILSMSDRIYVVCEGRITGQVDREEFTQEHLVKYAIGETD